jgi:hypothetical protein
MSSWSSVARSVGLFALGVVAALGLLSFVAGIGPASAARADLIEAIRNEPPEAKVEAYLRATAAGDDDAALAVWELPDWLARQEAGARMAERRTSVTRQLASLRLGERASTLDVEWWRSCCEPGVVESPREAGFARVSVSLTQPEDARLWIYVFDVVTRGGAYWGGTLDYPPREWMLVDVYRMGDEPLYWRFPR